MTTIHIGLSRKLVDPQERVVWWPALAVAAALVIVMLLTHQIVAIDDAFISYRYAENLARSGEFVFNHGERVEGATNLLWILILAGLRLATCISLEWLSIGASLALLTFAVARCFMLLRSIGLGVCNSVLVVVAVFGIGDTFLTMTAGLEAALYAGLMSEALFSVQAARTRTLGFLIGLLFMTRPEGIIVGALLLIPFLPPFADGRSALRAAGPAIFVIGATTLWRALYFGALIPNSILDKSFAFSLLPGVIEHMSLPYLFAFVRTDISFAIILFTATIGIAVSLARPSLRSNAAQSGLLISVTLITVASWLIVARNGGDWMPHFRLLTQYSPCYCVLLGSTFQKWSSFRRPVFIFFAGVAVWIFGQRLIAGHCCAVNIETSPPAGVFSAAADLLQPLVGPTDVVSVEAAGLLPYRLMTTRIHDPIGLMDSYIARYGTPAIPYGKTDIHYTFDQIRPSFMIWHWAGHILHITAAERANYTAFCFARCSSREEAAIVLVRNDRLDDEVKTAFRSWAPWPLIGGGEEHVIQDPEH